MFTRDVVVIDGGRPTTALATPDAPHAHLPPLWATATFDAGRCRVRQPTVPVRVRDVATEAELEIAPALIDDMPPADATIVYRAAFNETGHLTGRLVPLRTLDSAAAAPCVEMFGARRDAAALFLGRYMPYSRAALIAMHGDPALGAVVQMLRLMPGLLAMLGYIDVQGARQAFVDFFPDTPYGAASTGWWRRLLVSTRALQHACAANNCGRVQHNASLATLVDTLSAEQFSLTAPDGDAVTFWTAYTADLRTSICDYYAAHGRVGGPCAVFADALHAYDMMFWRSSAAALQLRPQMAGWLEPPASLHALGPQVQAAVSRLPSALPVVVFAEAERWRPYDMVYALATLLLAAPQTRDAAGMYAITGSAVPVKIVILFNASKYADTYAALTPQAKS